ncbi:transcriptional regulator family: Fungal Specific TF [Penicillium taxi]|uniref:transcriptional regulator family: Fungal Specific TF n=1 Tax=Penicillium taxi TaxID=168475 RepID=UPI0025451A5D|nr:transcriptional regulator family: Fungal Specific TF [Penicillium taxi]KAJ5909219.1 transcriptional regulator family: Fungal Specific TF [Penicillium taxi]
MSVVSQDEADRVLRLKISIELTCHKVKCDGNNPCQTCVRRKHPQICTYDLAVNSRRRSVLRQRVALSASPSSSNVARSENVEQPRPDDSSKNYVYSGDNSVVSLLRLRSTDANDSVAREVGSVLGLQNTFDNYPFMDINTPKERWKALLSLLPQRAEVLKFFHYYRVTVFPFNPILADMDRFESELCTYLNAHATGELHDTENITDRWMTNKAMGHISLVLATLAAGAHYSDIDYPQRLELSSDFARRSFHALRLANFLFRPSLDVIQSLLILGNTMQNMGQSDAAWALLGSTVRLAQTMGLHTARSTIHWPEHVQTKARTLWSSVVWQDSLLCLCYDRPPIVTVMGWPLENSFYERQDLSYAEVMHFLCRLGLDIMRPESFGRHEADRAIEGLQALDNACQRGVPHLRTRERCTTLQQHLEHLALRMHSSFCVSVICRPAMKQSNSLDLLPQTGIMRARAKGSLIDSSNAFLEFQALSVVPLRSWSMVHTVLSSTLLLCIWEETHNDSECRSLQQKVIDVFSSFDSKASDDEGNKNQWLSARHIRALVTLRSNLDRQGDAVSTEKDNLTAAGSNPAFTFESGNPDYSEIINSFDTSPVSYLESIMNVPLFDFTQDIGFF